MQTNVGTCNFFKFQIKYISSFTRFLGSEKIFLVSWGNSSAGVLGIHEVTTFSIYTLKTMIYTNFDSIFSLTFHHF